MRNFREGLLAVIARKDEAAVIALSDTATVYDNTLDNTTTLNLVQSSLTDGYVLVSIGNYNGGSHDTPTVTYDSVSMVDLDPATTGTQTVHLFGLAVGNKASGTYAATITWAAEDDESAVVVSSWNNVNQTTPTGTAVFAGGNSSAPSVTVTGVNSGEVVVDAQTSWASNSTTVGAGQTVVDKEDDASSNNDIFCSYDNVSTGSVDMTWTLSGSVDWQSAAVALKPA